MALPSFKVLTLTDAAADRVKDIMAKADRPIAGVRVHRPTRWEEAPASPA